MLLALDVGNSNVTIGVFEGSQVRERRRLRTIQAANSDGFLLARGDDQRERVILAGGVRPCS